LPWLFYGSLQKLDKDGKGGIGNIILNIFPLKSLCGDGQVLQWWKKDSSMEAHQMDSLFKEGKKESLKKISLSLNKVYVYVDRLSQPKIRFWYIRIMKLFF